MAYEENFTDDRLKDALVAETIFNWVWLERLPHNGTISNKPLKGLFPPENDPWGWERCNYTPQSYQPAKPETPCFVDWPRCACKPSKKHPWQWDSFETPRFTTDVKDDHMAMEQVVTKFTPREVIEFQASVLQIWHDRSGLNSSNKMDGFVLYKPGDYSNAALRMFQSFHPDHPAFTEKRVFRGKED